MNVIEIDHLTYSYPGAEQPTLKGITVKIKKGDFPRNRWQQRLREIHFL